MINNIDLEGLLSDDLVLYNKIMNAYYEKMTRVSASASISCNIIINNIELKNSNNCRINVINKCFTNSYLSLNTLLETIIENLEFVSDDIRNRIEKNLGIVLDSSIDQSNKGFIKRCNIDADVSNTINVKKISVNNCASTKPLVFDFYNTGDAKANCGIIELLNALSKKNINESENLSNKFDFILNKVFNLNLKDYMYLIFIFSFILIAIIFVSEKEIRNFVIFKFNTRFKPYNFY